MLYLFYPANDVVSFTQETPPRKRRRLNTISASHDDTSIETLATHNVYPSRHKTKEFLPCGFPVGNENNEISQNRHIITKYWNGFSMIESINLSLESKIESNVNWALNRLLFLSYQTKDKHEPFIIKHFGKQLINNLLSLLPFLSDNELSITVNFPFIFDEQLYHNLSNFSKLSNILIFKDIMLHINKPNISVELLTNYYGNLKFNLLNKENLMLIRNSSNDIMSPILTHCILTILNNLSLTAQNHIVMSQHNILLPYCLEVVNRRDFLRGDCMVGNNLNTDGGNVDDGGDGLGVGDHHFNPFYNDIHVCALRIIANLSEKIVLSQWCKNVLTITNENGNGNGNGHGNSNNKNKIKFGNSSSSTSMSTSLTTSPLKVIREEGNGELVNNNNNNSNEEKKNENEIEYKNLEVKFEMKSERFVHRLIDTVGRLLNLEHIISDASYSDANFWMIYYSLIILTNLAANPDNTQILERYMSLPKNPKTTLEKMKQLLTKQTDVADDDDDDDGAGEQIQVKSPSKSQSVKAEASVAKANDGKNGKMEIDDEVDNEQQDIDVDVNMNQNMNDNMNININNKNENENKNKEDDVTIVTGKKNLKENSNDEEKEKQKENENDNEEKKSEEKKTDENEKEREFELLLRVASLVSSPDCQIKLNSIECLVYLIESNGKYAEYLISKMPYKSIKRRYKRLALPNKNINGKESNNNNNNDNNINNVDEEDEDDVSDSDNESDIESDENVEHLSSSDEEEEDENGVKKKKKRLQSYFNINSGGDGGTVENGDQVCLLDDLCCIITDGGEYGNQLLRSASYLMALLYKQCYQNIKKRKYETRKALLYKRLNQVFNRHRNDIFQACASSDCVASYASHLTSL